MKASNATEKRKLYLKQGSLVSPDDLLNAFEEEKYIW